MSQYEAVSHMMGLLTWLAVERQQPLIILENPKFAEARANTDPKNTVSAMEFDPFILTIGNASVSFDGFYPAEMIEVYAKIKVQLEVEAVLASRNADAKSP